MGHYQYLPYGGLLSSSAPLSGNPFTFTAREDDGTGLMYYRARYYDPALQVFISQDPLGDDQRYVGVVSENENPGSTGPFLSRIICSTL